MSTFPLYATQQGDSSIRDSLQCLLCLERLRIKNKIHTELSVKRLGGDNTAFLLTGERITLYIPLNPEIIFRAVDYTSDYTFAPVGVYLFHFLYFLRIFLDSFFIYLSSFPTDL